ncbi:DMT family transporter [Pseudomonas putida]
MKSQTRGVLEMTSAMVISGTVGWFVLMSGQAALDVVFWRCLFGALAMLVACGTLGVFGRYRPSGRQVGLACLGGVALILNWVLLFSAYGRASIAIATVVYHTQPFMLLGLGAVILREQVAGRALVWLLVAFAGLLLIVFGGGAGAAGPNYLYGVALALGSAFFYAVAALIAKGLKGMPAPLLVLIQMLVGVVMLAPFVNVSAVGQGVWGYLAVIGVVHTGVMSTLLYGAIQRIPTALVGALSFVYPVVAIAVDWLGFGHALGAVQLLGALGILLAAAGMTVFQGRVRSHAEIKMSEVS